MSILAKEFRHPVVWQKAHNLVSSVYDFSSRFPHSEFCELTTPMRLSAVSVPASIMEGYRENNRKKQMKLFCSARVSLEKTRHYLLMSGKLNFGDTSALINEVDEMAQLLSETTIVAKHIKNNNVAC